jgi:iron only hydrogenase large subunit-like protein
MCPTQSYYENSDLAVVQEALQDESKFVVALLSPVVGVSIGEEFEQGSGMALNQQLAASLKTIGFDRVFDTAVGADVVILEESYELLTRLKSGKRLPMFSSSSPAWIKYVEHFYPDRLALLSSCKSPTQALAALIKSYFAKQANLTPEQVFTVSLTPCTAEKFERTRPEMVSEGYPAVDACLTTKELAGLLKGTIGDAILSIPPEPYDTPFDSASGAGIIWGAAGGMAEGVMRTFY